MDMGVEICLGTNGASRMLRKRRFDAVIVECSADGTGLDVLEELRADSPNQNTITVGVVDDPEAMKAAFATGANFVLAKPISVEDAGRILRFTRGMVTRMVRRFLRVAVHHLSHVDLTGMQDPAFILDLSEGGMAIQSLAPMQDEQPAKVSFFLPGTAQRIEATAKVVWTDPTGRIGLEFTEIAEPDRLVLKNWVVERMTKTPQDVPDGSIETPATVRVLSQWMQPLARVIDGAFIIFAAAVFCLTAFLMLRGEAHFPLSFTFLLAFIVGTLLYAGIFFLLDVRFPGTRAMQSLLALASSRHAA